MRNILPKSIEALSGVLSSLPGVGPKTANRLTFYLLGREDGELERFGEAFIELKKNLVNCSRCHIISESDPCPICDDSARDQTKLIVVEEPLDVLAMEKARFNGVYHVLGGQVSPINNVSPSDLKIKELLQRLEDEDIKEAILATDPSLEGEATALYIDDQVKTIKQSGGLAEVTITRLARGLPVGGDLEYADELTLARALEGRQSYKVRE